MMAQLAPYEITVENIKKLLQTEIALKSAARAYRNALKDLEKTKTTKDYQAYITTILIKHTILGNCAISWADTESKYLENQGPSTS